MRNRFVSALTAALLALCLVLAPACVVFAAGETIVTIYHTNDMHGRVDAQVSGPHDSPIGIAQIAAVKANTPNAILLDAGDATQGTPVAALSQGACVIELMNAAGYDAMAIGNHEFDYSFDTLLGLRDQAAFPLLAANVRKDGEAPFKASVILEAGGVRIGV